ncbi:hypothetical protein EAI_01405, partial [Harpegnathos saltator]
VPITIVRVYLPHCRNEVGLGSLVCIKGILDRVGNMVRQCQPRLVVITGNFNAHSIEWGCRPRQEDSRDRTMVDWAAGLSLLLMNRGSTSICVRLKGEFVIDLTWAS